MKRKNGLILMAVILALAVGFYIAATVLSRKEAQNGEETVDESVRFISKASTDVTAVSYRGQSAEFGFTVSNGSYRFDADPDFPIDPNVASSMTGTVAVITFDRKLPAGDASEYGLDEPQAVVTAAYSDGASVTLRIGGYNRYTDSYYCDIGDGAVYLLGSGFLDAFDVTINELLLDETITVPDGGLADVTKIEIRTADGGYDYLPTEIPKASDPDGDGEEPDEETETVSIWKKVPVGGESTGEDYSDTVTQLYRQLFYADLVEWKDYHVVSADRMAAYGMDNPAVSVTVRYTETVAVTGEDSSSTVSKTVERVVGFLIGDRLPEETEEEAEPRRYFMLEGGAVLYILTEDALSALFS